MKLVTRISVVSSLLLASTLSLVQNSSPAFAGSCPPPAEPWECPQYSQDEYSQDEYSQDEYSQDEYSQDEYSQDEYSQDEYSQDEYHEDDLNNKSNTKFSILIK